MDKVKEFESALITLDITLKVLSIFVVLIPIYIGYQKAFIYEEAGGYTTMLIGGAIAYGMMNAFRTLSLGLAFTLVQIAKNTDKSGECLDD
jgi:hypothetical protein